MEFHSERKVMYSLIASVVMKVHGSKVSSGIAIKTKYKKIFLWQLSLSRLLGSNHTAIDIE